MRTITITCLAILLFSAIAHARLGGPTATTPSATDVTNFLSGVWESIGLGHDFEDFSSCIQVDNNAGAQLQKAMIAMTSSSKSDVNQGFNGLADVITPIVKGLKACDMKDKYMTTISQIIKNFAKSDNLTVQTNTISIDGVNIYSEVTAAYTACDSGNFATCGSEIGNAMGEAFYGQGNVTTASQAAQINAIPNITWTASDNTGFSNVNLWKFKKERVTLRRKKNAVPDSAPEDNDRRSLVTIPASFDARTNWPNCVHAIRDQGNCGDCWAFAASEVLSDRFCIVTNKSTNTVLSPQYLVSCDTTESACNGGYLYYSWKFLEKTGDVSDSCFPYQSGNGVVPTCSSFSMCSDGSTLRKYYAKVNSTKAFTTPTAIQTEILTNGPVETGFDVYSDFMYYSSGIYTNTTGATYVGGHAVKIIGWGNSNGTNYWIAANSWGTSWGQAGYFYIKFGSCSIDSNVYAGLPDTTRQ